MSDAPDLDALTLEATGHRHIPSFYEDCGICQRVRSVLARAVEAEREACAEIAMITIGIRAETRTASNWRYLTNSEIAARIRARGAKPGEGA